MEKACWKVVCHAKSTFAIYDWHLKKNLPTSTEQANFMCIGAYVNKMFTLQHNLSFNEVAPCTHNEPPHDCWNPEVNCVFHF